MQTMQNRYNIPIHRLKYFFVDQYYIIITEDLSTSKYLL